MHNFIFSNKFSCRLSRHLVFWIVRILIVIVYNNVDNYNEQTSFWSNLPGAFISVPFLLLITDIPFCYVVIYFLVPKFFLKRAYISFVTGLIFISAIVLAAS